MFYLRKETIMEHPHGWRLEVSNDFLIYVYITNGFTYVKHAIVFETETTFALFIFILAMVIIVLYLSSLTHFQTWKSLGFYA